MELHKEAVIRGDGKPLTEGFRFSSDTNSRWLDLDGIKRLVEPFERLYAAGKLEA